MVATHRVRRLGLLWCSLFAGVAGCTQSAEIPLANVPQVKLSGSTASKGKIPPAGQRSPDNPDQIFK